MSSAFMIRLKGGKSDLLVVRGGLFGKHLAQYRYWPQDRAGGADGFRQTKHSAQRARWRRIVAGKLVARSAADSVCNSSSYTCLRWICACSSIRKKTTGTGECALSVSGCDSFRNRPDYRSPLVCTIFDQPVPRPFGAGNWISLHRVDRYPTCAHLCWRVFGNRTFQRQYSNRIIPFHFLASWVRFGSGGVCCFKTGMEGKINFKRMDFLCGDFEPGRRSWIGVLPCVAVYGGCLLPPII